MSYQSAIRDLLRAPNRVVEQCQDPGRLRERALMALACVALGAAAFGGVMGSFRGGLQIGFSAIKLPLVLLASLALSVPAFHGLVAGVGRPRPLRFLVALTLAASARAALVLLALAPVLWLLIDIGLGYHSVVLVAAVCYGIAGVAGAGIVLRAFRLDLRGVLTVTCLLGVLAAVGGQSAWLLRPFFGRPAQTEIPFVRAPEGGFADAVYRSGRSMLGIYDREFAPGADLPLSRPGPLSPEAAVLEELRRVPEGSDFNGPRRDGL